MMHLKQNSVHSTKNKKKHKFVVKLLNELIESVKIMLKFIQEYIIVALDHIEQKAGQKKEEKRKSISHFQWKSQANLVAFSISK